MVNIANVHEAVSQLKNAVFSKYFPISKYFSDLFSLCLSVCLWTVQYVCDCAVQLRSGSCASSIEAYQLPHRNTHTMITHVPTRNPQHLINNIHLFEYTNPISSQSLRLKCV